MIASYNYVASYIPQTESNYSSHLAITEVLLYRGHHAVSYNVR